MTQKTLLTLFSQTFYLASLFHTLHANPSVYLIEPKQEGSYFTTANNLIAQVPLEYQLFGIEQPLSSYELCFSVKSNHYATIIVKETCLPAEKNQLILQNLKEDEYTLTYYLRERAVNPPHEWQEVPFSKTSNVFQVLNYETALPKIELVNSIVGDNVIKIAAKAETKTGELALEYKYSQTALDVSNFAVCVRIVDAINKNAVKLQWTCLQPTQRSFALSNLPLGKYTINLILTDMNLQTQGKNGFILSTEIERIIVVDELKNFLPKLSLVNPLQEYVVDPTTGKSMIQIVFQVDGIKTALQQVGVCIQILITETNEELLKYSCLPLQNNVITLQNIDVGNYVAQMVLAKVSNAKDYFPTSKVEFSVVVNKPVEFIPTYDWQRLHVWHTIPSGIETHLPLGPGTFQKEARIPDPWRLQLTMPDPCKYFLRMDVHRNTKLSQILEKASEQCELEVSCFRLKVGESEIDFTNALSTVEDSNLFNADKHLLFDEICREKLATSTREPSET